MKPKKRNLKNHFNRLAGLFAFAMILFILGPGVWLCDFLLFYETSMETADVMLVGGAGETIKTAFKNYEQGIVKAFLVIDGIPKQYKGLEGNVCEHNLIVTDLIKHGIPKEKIYSFGKDPHSLLDTQIMLRKSMLKHGFTSYLCYPPDYATRFTKMLHDQTFPEGKVKAIIQPTSGARVFRKHWLAIQNTLIRMLFWNMMYKQTLQDWIQDHSQRIHDGKKV